MRWIKPLALTALSVAGAVACSGEPIPRRVISGTTFVMPFTTNVVMATTIAYAVDPGANAGTVLTLPDPQRGRSRFSLCRNDCAEQVDLRTRYIGRLLPDRGSARGLTGVTELTPPGSATPFIFANSLNGEPIVIADVPIETPAGIYSVAYFVDPPGAEPEVRTILQGSIEVVTVPGSVPAFSDIKTVLSFGNADATASLQGFVPYPQLSLVLLDLDVADRPAAGSLVLRYPAGVKIEGAFEAGVLGQGSLVRMAPEPGGNSVRLVFIDPDRKTTSLRVAFSLTDPNGAAVSAGGFTIVPDSQQLYRSDGTVLPIVETSSNPGNKFRVEAIF